MPAATAEAPRGAPEVDRGEGVAEEGTGGRLVLGGHR